MKNIKIIFLFSCLIFLYGFQSIEIARNDFIYIEIRCCSGNPSIDYSIKFVKEGLICHNPFPNETNEFSGAIFFKYEELDKNKVMELEEFLIRNDFFLYDSIYKCDKNILGGALNTIVVRKKDEFKVIKYFECYHTQIDSIFLLMNALIPHSKYQKFQIPGNKYAERNNIKCITY